MLYAKSGLRTQVLKFFLFAGCRFQASFLRKMALLLVFLPQVMAGYTQGLLFTSNDSLLRERTTYEVFHNYTPTFKNQFSVQFDLSIWDKKNFGHVFTIKDEQNKIYSLSYIFSDDQTGYLNLNVGSESNKIRIPLHKDLLTQRQWIAVKLDFNLKNDSVRILINNKEFKAGKFGFGHSMSPGLFFGKYEYLTDVPSMAIKNLVISGAEKEYVFPLNEWKGEVVHNKNGESVGVVEHPNWLINESYFWKQRYSANFNDVAGLCFDGNNQRILIYGKQELTIYDLTQRTASVLPYKNELPVAMILGKSIFNVRENKCYVYEANNVRQGDPTIAALDLNTMTWEGVGRAFIPQQRHHHNTFYDSQQNDLYLFGGYGSFAYYNTFFKYNRPADEWTAVKFKGDTLTPRFFSASGKAENENEILIFGGFGNASGQQIVGGKHSYDLYRVNLSTQTIKKCWEIHGPDSNFVPANNLILSADKKHFYAACYPHHLARPELSLYKFSIADGSYETVSAPIPVISEKIETDINLFLNERTGELYCVTQEFADAKKSVIKLYSLLSAGGDRCLPEITDRHTRKTELALHWRDPAACYSSFGIRP